MMNVFRLPVQVKSGCHAPYQLMRSEAIPLEVFGQPEHAFNASRTLSQGREACAAGEPFDSCQQLSRTCVTHSTDISSCLRMMMEKDIGYTLQMGSPKVTEASTDNEKAFKKGDLVWYAQRDGSYKAAKVIESADSQACHAQHEGARPLLRGCIESTLTSDVSQLSLKLLLTGAHHAAQMSVINTERAPRSVVHRSPDKALPILCRWLVWTSQCSHPRLQWTWASL